MGNPARLWLIINRASGSHDERRVEALQAVLEDGGYTPVEVLDCQECACPRPADAERHDISHIAVLGGDGTINSVLTALEGWGGEVLPLPGGTANLLCTALFGDDDPLAIAAMLVNGKLTVRRLPMIEGAGCRAFAEIVAGPGAMWADVREDLRQGEASALIEDALAATGEAASGSMVMVREPRLGRPDGYPGVRLSLEGEGLRIQGYGGEGFVDFLKQGAAILGRDFRDGPHDELGCERSVSLASIDGSAIELMVDGERHTGGGAETFRVAELDLDLLGPKV